MNASLRRHAYWMTAVIFFGTLYGLFLLVSYPEWYKYQQLRKSGRQTIGTIVGKDLARHRSIKYSYEVAGLSYSGSANASLARLPFDEIQSGDHVQITYVFEHPEISVAGNPTILYLSWSRLLFLLAPSICLALSIPLAVLIWVVTRKERERKAERTGQS